MRSVWRLLGLLTVAAVSWGCAEQQVGNGTTPVAEVRSSPYDIPAYLPIAYLKPPIRVATNRVEVIQRYSDYSGVQPTDFITSPERVARLWAQQRLRTGGGGDKVQFIIEKVGARSDRVGDGEVVTAVLEVEVVIAPADGREAASTTVLVDSETTIAGPVSPERRRMIYHQISRNMADKLDEQLSKSVQTKLAAYLQPKRTLVAKAAPPVPQPVAVAPPQAVKPVQVVRPTLAPRPATPARARVTAAKPTPLSSSPVAGADGRLPSSAWRKGWNWKKTP